MPEYVLLLYVTGGTALSSSAAVSIQSFCEQELAGRYSLDIVDVLRRPDLAEVDNIVATPTLIKRSPAPERRLVGNLEDWLRLRLVLDLPASAGVAWQPGVRLAAGRPGIERPLDILVVEDNPGDARLLEEALREAPVPSTPYVVTDGVEALALLTGRGAEPGRPRPPQPDLIVLDLDLPRVHGANVLAALKGDPDLRRIPVAVFTGTAKPDDLVAAYDRHANCVIAKPQDLDEYGQKVREILHFWAQTAVLPTV